MIYIAGAIDRVPKKPFYGNGLASDTFFEHRSTESTAEGFLVKELRKFGIGQPLFVPKHAFDVIPTMAKAKDVDALVAINRHALEQCDLMLLYYRPGVESWGCPQELMFAWSALVPVVVVVPEGTVIEGLSIYLRAWVKPANFVFSVEAAAARILDILSLPQAGSQ